MMRMSYLAMAVLLVSGTAGCRDSAGPADPEVSPHVSVGVQPEGHGELLDRYTGEIAAAGDWAYTATWGGLPRDGNRGDVLYIWNVAQDVPQRTGALAVDSVRNLGDVEISDDGKLLVVATEPLNPTSLATGSIVIYDRSDPASPHLLARHMTISTRFGGVHTVKLGRVNGVLYAFLAVNPSSMRNGPQLVVVDLSDPAQPKEVLVKEMGNPVIHDVFVRDGLLFTALWNDGMTIWDIGGGGKGGSPANPVAIGNVATVGGDAHNIWWFHDPANGSKRYVFVGEEGRGVVGGSSSGDIHVVDVSNMASPREVAFYTVPGAGTHNFWMDEAHGILYAAYYNAGVRAIDMRGALGTCAASARAADGRCDLSMTGREIAHMLDDTPVYVWGVHLVGSKLYASDMLSGIFKFDVSQLAM